MVRQKRHRMQYVLPTGSGWAVIEEGRHVPTGIFQTMDEAAQDAETRAQRYHTDVIIYGMDGPLHFTNY